MNEFNAVSAEELTQVDGGWSIGGIIAAAAVSVACPLAGAVILVMATESNAY
jgi:hypothetical protein